MAVQIWATPRLARLNFLALPASDTGETARAYSDYTVSNGYGQITKAGAEATQGAWIKVRVSEKIKVVTENSFDKARTVLEKTLTEDEKSYLNDNYAGYGAAAGWLGGFFGIIGGGGYNHNKNATRNYSKLDKDINDAVKEAFKTLQEGDVEVAGDIEITGVDPIIPTHANVFVESTTIKTQTDKGAETKTVISTKPIAVDSDTAQLVPTRNNRINFNPALSALSVGAADADLSTSPIVKRQRRAVVSG